MLYQQGDVVLKKVSETNMDSILADSSAVGPFGRPRASYWRRRVRPLKPFFSEDAAELVLNAPRYAEKLLTEYN